MHGVSLPFSLQEAYCNLKQNNFSLPLIPPKGKQCNFEGKSLYLTENWTVETECGECKWWLFTIYASHLYERIFRFKFWSSSYWQIISFHEIAPNFTSQIYTMIGISKPTVSYFMAILKALLLQFCHLRAVNFVIYVPKQNSVLKWHMLERTCSYVILSSTTGCIPYGTLLAYFASEGHGCMAPAGTRNQPKTFAKCSLSVSDRLLLKSKNRT